MHALKQKTKHMQILHISDWHGNQVYLLEQMKKWSLNPDIIIATGDMAPDFWNYKSWLEKPQPALQYRYWEQTVLDLIDLYGHVPIVSAVGGHCWYKTNIPGLVEGFDEVKPRTIKVNGLKIGGFGGRPVYNGMLANEIAVNYVYEAIEALDKDIDILVTHFPPYGILDTDQENAYATGGSWSLKLRLNNFKNLRLHTFGMSHASKGTIVIGKTMFSNAATWFNVIEI